MSKLDILKFPNKFLLKPTKPVENIDGSLQRLIDDMAETMYAAPGVGWQRFRWEATSKF